MGRGIKLTWTAPLVAMAAVVAALALGCGALLAIAWTAPSPGGAAPAFEIHYSPEEDLERIDVVLIGSAHARLDMAAYVLTDQAVIQALARAAARGVKVRVWRDEGMAEKIERDSVEARLGALPGVELSANEPGAPLMHLKGYCIDGRTLRTGSANFSKSGETRQDNDLVVLRGDGVCDGFEQKFARVWKTP
jgi:phosphatidylserine/phosphatidylglycerophosphate/cardiolipin synthase-like enzyme